VIVAATNFPESLDPALVRPGRFDKHIHVPLPDLKGRKEIIDYYLTKVNCSNDVLSSRLARSTPGLSGADLDNIVNLAAIKAGRRNQKLVTMKLLEEAYDDVTMGVERKSAVIPEENRRITAYHEGGHAMVAFFTSGSSPIRKVTIMPRGSSLGMVASMMEDKEMVSQSRKQVLAQIAVCMAGRAAEELILGVDDTTTGASSDLAKATNLATRMITQWGMSNSMGIFHYDSDKPSLSSNSKQLIEEEVRVLLQKQYDYAKQILKTHQNELHQLANALLEHETLTGEQVKLILEGHPLPKIAPK